MKPVVLGVPGYGCELTYELKEYLDCVLICIRSSRPVAVILSGGRTQRKRYPHDSEARVMERYLKERLRNENFPLPAFFLDHDAYTSIDNARNIADLWRRYWSQATLEVFSEDTRSLKLEFLMKYFCGQEIRVHSVAYDSTGIRHWVKQLISTPIELMGARIPKAIRFLHDYKVRRARHA